MCAFKCARKKNLSISSGKHLSASFVINAAQEQTVLHSMGFSLSHAFRHNLKQANAVWRQFLNVKRSVNLTFWSACCVFFSPSVASLSLPLFLPINKYSCFDCSNHAEIFYKRDRAKKKQEQNNNQSNSRSGVSLERREKKVAVPSHKKHAHRVFFVLCAQSLARTLLTKKYYRPIDESQRTI